jgi:phage FluMu gp28-like protein
MTATDRSRAEELAYFVRDADAPPARREAIDAITKALGEIRAQEREAVMAYLARWHPNLTHAYDDIGRGVHLDNAKGSE